MTCLTLSDMYVLDVFRAVFDGIMITLIIITNIFILGVVARRWWTRGIPLGNISSSLLVINLSAADGLVGIFSIFYFLPRYDCRLAQHLRVVYVPCILRFALVIFAHLVSGYTLVAIALDRYVAVMQPVRYRDILSPRRTLLVMALTWILALGGSMILLVWNERPVERGEACDEDNTLPVQYTLTLGLLSQFIIMGCVVVAHWRIHRVALSLTKRSSDAGNAISERGLHASTRAARVLLIILCVYVASWAPFMITLIVKSSLERDAIPIRVLEVASSIVNFNYLVNPFIYAYNNRQVRKTLGQFVNSLKKKAIEASYDVTQSVSHGKE